MSEKQIHTTLTRCVEIIDEYGNRCGVIEDGEEKNEFNINST